MRTILHSLPDHSVTSAELDKAKTAIEQFIYSCSHTLRAPLKSIAGLVYLLKNANGLSRVSAGEYLQSIERTVDKMETLLNDLELFLTNSRQDIAVHTVDIAKVITDVLAGFEAQLSENNIKVILSAAHQQQCVYTDEPGLRVVLSHIIANAITFQDPLNDNKRIGIKVTITSAHTTITIRDNGIGIRKEIRHRIFDLFYRGSELSKGSGVGLYVASEVMKKIGGELSVRSSQRTGTSIKMIFPNLSL